MQTENNKSRVTYITIAAIVVIVGVILYFSLSDFGEEKARITSNTQTASDGSIPGGSIDEIKHELTGEEMQGYYIDDSDGWYYSFTYAPEGEMHGSFTAGYDQNHAATQNNPQSHFTASGKWTLTHGEIKLYNEESYQQSMWVCGDYIVDSQNYFVGEVPKDKKNFQASFTCKAVESGDTQIMNFYSDGKLIMEIIRNDGASDSTAEEALPPYQLIAGTYEIKDNIITGNINGSTQAFYIMDDGIAKWVYNKR